MADTVDTLTEGKQNKIFDLKQGFFRPTEGQNNDMGICTDRGKFYLAVKVNNEWRFTEIKQSRSL
jgi:hypothetical protein